MADLQYRNLISFIREKPDNGETTEKAATKQSSGLTGEEARSFYENIISQDVQSESRGGRKPSNKLDKGVHNKMKIVTEKCSKSSGRQIKVETPEQDKDDSPTSSKRSWSKECVATEQCHSHSVKSDTEGGYRLGMALLRCAEHGEKKEMKHHLENGVAVDFQDSYGWTALMCAAVAGQVRIVKHLVNTGADVSIVNNQQEKALQLAQGFLKTVLKRDRACLGSEAEKERWKMARVTHFGPNDSTAVKSAQSCTRRVESAKTLRRRAKLKKEKREWERNLRQYMNID